MDINENKNEETQDMIENEDGVSEENTADTEKEELSEKADEVQENEQVTEEEKEPVLSFEYDVRNDEEEKAFIDRKSVV